MTTVQGSRLPRVGLAFHALPDSGRTRCWIAPDGEPVIRLPGLMDLPALADAALARAYPAQWHAPSRPLALPARLEAVVNMCASADHCAGGLAALDAALPLGVPVLNHPRAVARARRDLAAEVFAPVTGLDVPVAHRFLADRPRAFMAAFDAAGLRYPVTVEAAGDDGAADDPGGIAGVRGPFRIGHPGDWQQVFDSSWGGRTHYLVQRAASRSPWRLLLGMAGKAGHAEIYPAVPVGAVAPPPSAGLGDFAKRLMLAARACLPLDCWTMVLALEPGRPVLERVIVGLPLPGAPGTPAETGAARKLRQALAGAVAAMLADPGSWRADAGRLPPVMPPAGDSDAVAGVA